MSTAWGDLPPGLTGTHWGGDGIGKGGAALLTETASGTAGIGIIQQAATVNPTKEYRLQVVEGFAGFVVNENGSGTSMSSGVARCKVFEDGIEL